MKNQQKEKNRKKGFRRRSAVALIFGDAQVPRLSVFRSNSHIYGQIIDDKKRSTIVSASDLEIKNSKLNKTQRAMKVGELLATKAKAVKILKVVFDRGGNRYHGRVKALAEGSRKGGLVF